MADINTFGNPTYFNNDVTFYKDVTIGGEFKYDELSLVRLTVTDKITAGIVSTFGGQSNQILMADGSTTTRFISTETAAPSSSLGEDGDIYLIVSC